MDPEKRISNNENHGNKGSILGALGISALVLAGCAQAQYSGVEQTPSPAPSYSTDTNSYSYRFIVEEFSEYTNTRPTLIVNSDGSELKAENVYCPPGQDNFFTGRNFITAIGCYPYFHAYLDFIYDGPITVVNNK